MRVEAMIRGEHSGSSFYDLMAAKLASPASNRLTFVMTETGRRLMKLFTTAALAMSIASGVLHAQINAGEKPSDSNLPFTMTQVADFKLPWRIAFLPDGRMLVTEKVGPVWLVTQQGEKTPIRNVPA